MRLQGSWAVGSSRKIDQADMHTQAAGVKPVSGTSGMHCFVEGVTGEVRTNSRGTALMLTNSFPGMHSMITGTDGSNIYWGEREWPIKLNQIKAGMVPKVHEVLCGEVGYWTLKDGKPTYSKEVGEVLELPEIDYFMGLEESAKEFKRLFLECAEEIHTLSGKPRVLCLLSGGTDSSLTAWALKEIGADVLALSVGVSEDDFDPSYARGYAKDLGLPYHFLKLPEDPQQLLKAVGGAILHTEMSEFSNIMMATCTGLARDYAAADARPMVYHGHFADEVLGYWMQAVGGLKKRMREAGKEVTAEAWRDYRAKFFMHTTPNNIQIARVCRVGNDCTGAEMDWRAIFYHPKLYNFFLSRSLDVTPCDMSKPLFYKALDGVFSTPAWNVKRKIGYYTGSGIGGLKKKHSFMSEVGLRNVFKVVRSKYFGLHNPY